MKTCEGVVEIDLVDFWEWVLKKEFSEAHGETRFGVPRVNKANGTMEIDYAYGEECSPDSWAVKPKAITQWEELDEKKPLDLKVVDGFLNDDKFIQAVKEYRTITGASLEVAKKFCEDRQGFLGLSKVGI